MYDLCAFKNSKWYAIVEVASLSWFFVKKFKVLVSQVWAEHFFLHFWTNLDNLVFGLPTNTVIYVYEYFVNRRCSILSNKK